MKQTRHCAYPDRGNVYQAKNNEDFQAGIGLQVEPASYIGYLGEIENADWACCTHRAILAAFMTDKERGPA